MIYSPAMRRYSPRDWAVLILIGLAVLYYFNPGILQQPAGIGNAVTNLLTRLIVLAVSITVHEFGHAAVAYSLGDPTPKAQGRVSLNPLHHLDPLGTFMILFGPIGWGKPVVWNPRNVVKTNVRIALIAVSLAGIAMNLLLATLLYHGVVAAPWDLSRDATRLIGNMVQLNIALAAFNILPIPPLDGYNFWLGVLPPSLARFLWPLNQYGFLILIILIMAPGFGGPDLITSLIGPVLNFFRRLVTGGVA